MSADPIRLTQGRTVPEWALVESFIQSSGPGGQNVNKVATAVQLRLLAQASGVFTDAELRRLFKLAGSRATKAGEIVIEASRHRARERNRLDARERLASLIDRALAPPPPPRKKTRPTRGSVERRLKAKSARGTVKKLRGPVKGED
ncbi:MULTISPECIES: alternative ribosome rescue aminoacyl-tRNA hydrolase ArfB [unclassified Roseitalea]|uniref:alternative ribosome rescue aminoacyl-tRNA hydrolase ArfB n=1 Tax=unclassified Roseitalea TaxID=2639107 RepID=UPI00273FE82A|nr:MULTISPECIES: alternative ribosome rescue aminoacyl-tRNA hydrolase ArfB [unclassified Roseitalea]